MQIELPVDNLSPPATPGIPGAEPSADDEQKKSDDEQKKMDELFNPPPDKDAAKK